MKILYLIFLLFCTQALSQNINLICSGDTEKTIYNEYILPENSSAKSSNKTRTYRFINGNLDNTESVQISPVDFEKRRFATCDWSDEVISCSDFIKVGDIENFCFKPGTQCLNKLKIYRTVGKVEEVYAVRWDSQRIGKVLQKETFVGTCDVSNSSKRKF